MAKRSARTMFDPAPTSNDGLWSVSDLTGRIKGVLESDFAEVGVRGEVSNLARSGSGHLYFSLKDSRSQIPAVMWRAAAQKLVFQLKDGLEVRAWGSINVYEPKGQYQLLIKRIEPVGVGALELAFRQLFDRLKAEGLFDDERKRALPRFPRRIAVVASPTGDAVRDVIRVAGGRWPMAELLIAPSRVQGDGAAVELAEALALANRIADVDLVILARGGGSIEDLWAFNEEVLIRAIVASRLPVVSAVGHERDYTLSDYAADLRAATPTAAAMLTTPDVDELRQSLDALGLRMARRVRAMVDRTVLRVDGLAKRAESACRHAIERRGARLDSLKLRLHSAARRDLDRRQTALGQAAASLEALSPLGVLSRGYSLTQDAITGQVLRDAEALTPGQLVRTRLALGTFTSRVERVLENTHNRGTERTERSSG